LQQATNTFTAAQARLADLEAGATAADVSGASAEVRRAEAQLDTLTAVLPQDVAAAQAEVDRAQAQLDLLEAGTRQEEIDSARADVAAATANLQQALISLADAELAAPFAGTVALMDIEPGEQVSAGAIAAQVADLGNWEVRTEDLTEFDIVGVKPGDSVSLTFDAIPSLELTGTVDRIRPIGSDRRGDIVYTVVVIPDSTDDRLLWNMTSVVSFDKDQ
jgi:HlyD family secretion protein